MHDDRFTTLLAALPKPRRTPREWHRGFEAAYLKKPMTRLTVWYLRGYIAGVDSLYHYESIPRDDSIE